MEMKTEHHSSFTRLENLASEKWGSKVVYATDEFFGKKENLIKAERPISRPGVFTENGRWVDGWVTRRRRDNEHDFAIIKLGRAGVVKEILIDTLHMDGDLPSFVSIEGHSGTNFDQGFWEEILPKKSLNLSGPYVFRLEEKTICTHLRLSLYPGGGVSRLKVFGDRVQ